MNRSRFRTLLLDCLRCIGLVWAGLIVLAPVPAAAAPAFARIFTSHDVVMLLIDPVSGQIVDANPAAARFYGYPQRELRALGIDRLNTFSPAQVAEERQLAASEGRNYFIFRHRLASGDIRTVEVYSHPYVFDGRRLLLSIIHDITPGRFSRQDLWHYQAQLESMVDAQVKEIAANRARNTTVLLLGLLLQFGVIVALVLSNRRRRRVQHERDEIAAALADERRRLLDILHGTGAGTWEWDMRSDALRVNPTWLGFLGSSARAEGRLTDAAAQAFIHPHDLMRCLAARQQHLEGAHDEYECELRVRRHDGEWIWVLDRGRVVGRDPDGTPNCMAGTRLDISVRKSAEEKLRLAAGVFTHAREGILITDPDGVIIDVNEAFCRITGFARSEVLGQTPHVLSSGRHDAAFYAAMWSALSDKGHWHGEIWNRRKNGEPFAEMLTISAVRDAHGRTENYVALFSDITAQKVHADNLERIANYDALTQLPNRSLLAERLRQAMVMTQRRASVLAVVYIDLDGFKAVNDTYGHPVGDRLLLSLAGRFSQVLREGDTIARIGGDEFVALVMDLESRDAVRPTLDRLLAAATAETDCDGRVVQVSASIGVSFYTAASQLSADDLLVHADTAMYAAKEAGKNRYQFADRP